MTERNCLMSVFNKDVKIKLEKLLVVLLLLFPQGGTVCV